tara:strand:+ start:274 stop:750 length:477 start_codon:yes stop_codon:yes gene_type:complete
MSQIKVDSIIPRNGVPSGSQGGIIQYKYASNSSVRSTQSDSFVSSGLSITITPQSSDNKIIVRAYGVAFNNNQNSAGGAITIYRGSSTNIDPQGGDGAAMLGEEDSNNLESTICCEFIDSPNTTSSVTYNVFIRRLNGGEFFFGKRTTGAIIALEVSA